MKKTRSHRSNHNVITQKNPNTNKYNVITFVSLCYSFVITSTAYAALEIQSPVTQASLIYGRATEGEQIFLNETEIRQTPEGAFVLALPQDTADNLTLTTQSNNTLKTWTIPIIKRSWKEEIVNGLPPQKVSPDRAAQQQIANDNALLKKARTQTNYTVLPHCFSRPVDKTARISGHFGSRRILNGEKTTGHSGTDYALPTGSPVYAPADGIVRLTHPDMFYSGQTVLIDHGFGIYSSYSHLSQIEVQQGQHIKRHERIGTIGSSGRATGPHLHFTMTWFGVRVDPEFVLTHYACPE